MKVGERRGAWKKDPRAKRFKKQKVRSWRVLQELPLIPEKVLKSVIVYCHQRMRIEILKKGRNLFSHPLLRVQIISHIWIFHKIIRVEIVRIMLIIYSILIYVDSFEEKIIKTSITFSKVHPEEHGKCAHHISAAKIYTEHWNQKLKA